MDISTCVIPVTIVDNKMKALFIAKNGGRLYNTRVIGHVEWLVRCCPKGFTSSVDNASLTFVGDEPNSSHVVSTCLQAHPSWGPFIISIVLLFAACYTMSLESVGLQNMASLVEHMAKKNRSHFPIAVLLTTLVCRSLNEYKFIFFILRVQS